MGELVNAQMLFRKKGLMAESMPKLLDIVFKHLPGKVPEPDALRQLLVQILMHERFPLMDLSRGELEYLSAQLKHLNGLGPKDQGNAYFASLSHMKRQLQWDPQKLSVSTVYIMRTGGTGTSSLRHAINILSVAWQIHTQQDLILDERSYFKKYPRKSPR
ncbi:MAG: hypothetical protein ACOYUZ_04590 [Patescibacteria group bacterium]